MKISIYNIAILIIPHKLKYIAVYNKINALQNQSTVYTIRILGHEQML